MESYVVIAETLAAFIIGMVSVQVIFEGVNRNSKFLTYLGWVLFLATILLTATHLTKF